LHLCCKVPPDNTATTTDEQQQQRQRQRQLGSNCFYTMPGLCSTDTVEFFRIVRLVYVKPSTSPVGDANVDTLPPSIVYPISYETFVPELVQKQEHASSSIASSSSSLTAGKLHVDSMSDTLAKVDAFMQHSGTYTYLY